jgi:hypothetical protein
MRGEAAFDAWSLVHLVSGVVMRRMGFRFHNALALMIATEIIEAKLRIKSGGLGAGMQEHESPKNIAGDLLFGGIGWMIGGKK